MVLIRRGQQAATAAPLSQRQAQSRPDFALWPAGAYLLLVALFVAGASVLAWPLPESAFRSDNSPISWLSSAQLWAMSILAIRLGNERVLRLPLALWLAAAMAALAFDEQFMLHEQWKYGCGAWFSVCRYRWVTELPMLLVGALGVLSAVWLQLTLPRGQARMLLWLAIGIGLTALCLDLHALFDALLPFEEGVEVLAEALFMGTLLGLRLQSPERNHQ